MSAVISKVCSGPVLVSVRDDAGFVFSSGNHRRVPKVVSVNPASKKVKFVSGMELEINIILLCTCYIYNFDMIPCAQTSRDGKRVLSLYEHMIFLDENEDPTASEDIRNSTRQLTRREARHKGSTMLAFVGLPTMDSVFQVAEAQSVSSPDPSLGESVSQFRR